MTKQSFPCFSCCKTSFPKDGRGTTSSSLRSPLFASSSLEREVMLLKKKKKTCGKSAQHIARASTIDNTQKIVAVNDVGIAVKSKTQLENVNALQMDFSCCATSHATETDEIHVRVESSNHYAKKRQFVL